MSALRRKNCIMKWPDPIVNDFLLSNIVSLKVGGLVSLLCINFSFVGSGAKKN